jgi:uncharacterized membrane protein
MAGVTCQPKPIQEQRRDMTDQTDDGAHAAGAASAETEFISAERLVFFSDAVVAIAITLLALGLPLPNLTSNATNAQVLAAIRADHSDYLAFLISFVVIANHWRSHHRLYRDVHKLDGRIITLNFLWLLMIVVTPFATKLISANGGFGVRFTAYAVIQILTMLAFLLMNRHIKSSNLLRSGAPPPASAGDDIAVLAIAGMFAISIPVSFITQWAFLFWVFSPFAARAARRRYTRDTR